ncbi:MAG: ribosomal-processing cysteine protease Prp [Bacillota bacterium]|nr:ribosomal-processing cysteine protease Prp [Bacillota bacterium]
MTKIEFYLNDDDKLIGFEAKGHTGFGVQGEDLLCAGISLLTQSAVIGLSHFLSKDPVIDLRDGYLKCMVPDGISPDEMENAQVILKTVLLALEATKEDYGKFLSINKRRWS